MADRRAWVAEVFVIRVIGRVAASCVAPASVDLSIATTFLDTLELLKILLFVVDRRHIVAAAVPALRIVEHLDIIEDVLPGLVAGSVDATTNALSWQLPRRLMLCSRLCAFRKSRQS
jgi:hypothetical protein